MKHLYSFIIPVYKNKQMFFDHLRHNYPFMKGHEVIIVDDASHENIEKDMREAYPDILYIENEDNLGFGLTVNRGVEKAKGDIVVLLNSDVRLKNDICEELDKKFEREKLFAISFAQIERNDEVVGRNQLYFEKGFFNHRKHLMQQSGLTGWAEGGSMACRKDLFLEWGGFYGLYAPFYWEDIDLSFRARSLGYEVVYDADILVEHHHESTISKYFKKFNIQKIAFRNQLFFHWINITNRSLLHEHKKRLGIFLAKALLKLDLISILGFIEAMFSLPEVMKYRKQNIELFSIPNSQVISELSKV